jgi:hypothetical protein
VKANTRTQLARVTSELIKQGDAGQAADALVRANGMLLFVVSFFQIVIQISHVSSSAIE